MIRRWSHINNSQITINSEKSKQFKPFNYIRKLSKAYVFRTSLLSRRFNRRYLTKFKRKAYNRIRHKTNWSIYYAIFKFWSLDFLNNRYPVKFEFMLNLFTDNFFFFNFNFIKNKNPEGFNNWNFCYVNKLTPKPNYVSNKWNYLEFVSILKKTGSVSLGWSDLLWIDESLSPLLKQDSEDNSLYLNQLAVPLYSFWDDQLYAPAHSLKNYATVANYLPEYVKIVKTPDFDLNLIIGFSNDFILINNLNIKTILTLCFLK